MTTNAARSGTPLAHAGGAIEAALGEIGQGVDAIAGVLGRGLLPAAGIAARMGIPLIRIRADFSDRDAAAVAGQVAGVDASRASIVMLELVTDEGRLAASITRIREGAVTQVALVPVPDRDGGPTAGPGERWTEVDLLAGRLAVRASFDIDGVLCRDPLADEDDDAARYEEFLDSVEPLLLPRVPVDRIITSRLERYRPATEAWLARHGVRYRTLEMLDLATKLEREVPWVAERAKAAAYSASRSRLYIESDKKQAKRIASITGRAVLCLSTGDYHPPRWRARMKRRFSDAR